MLPKEWDNIWSALFFIYITQNPPKNTEAPKQEDGWWRGIE